MSLQRDVLEPYLHTEVMLRSPLVNDHLDCPRATTAEVDDFTFAWERSIVRQEHRSTPPLRNMPDQVLGNAQLYLDGYPIRPLWNVSRCVIRWRHLCLICKAEIEHRRWYSGLVATCLLLTKGSDGKSTRQRGSSLRWTGGTRACGRQQARLVPGSYLPKPAIKAFGALPKALPRTSDMQPGGCGAHIDPGQNAVRSDLLPRAVALRTSPGNVLLVHVQQCVARH